MSEEFEGLNLVELLDLLEPLPAPDPVSWAPQTVGWVWASLLLVVGGLLVARLVVRQRRTNAYRAAARAELASVGDDPVQVALILRRAALAGFPRSDVAGLSGDDWLNFLDQSFPGSGFSNGPGRVIAAAPYSPQPAPVPGLNRLAADWVRQHRNSGAT